MKKTLLISVLVLVAALSPVLANGGGEQTSSDAGVSIAVLRPTTIEEAWNSVYIQALDRVVAEKPHGLEVSYRYVESVSSADAERVMQGFAATGDYDILVYHGGQFGDAAENTTADYSDTLVVVNGSGFSPLGGNCFHADIWVHEAAYLLGIIAGSMSESGVIGAVAAYPYPNVNLPLNGYIEGARSVNPEIRPVVTYIESWFDPPKVKESAAAQIATGADVIYAERLGVFEAAREGGVYAFGHSSDQHDLAPDVVLSSSLYRWDPSIREYIDIWYNASQGGSAYNLPAETFTATMAEGGCDIAPFYDLESSIPDDVIARVDDAKAAIMSGGLVVPFIDTKAGE